ncbi:MAG: FMN-binding protein [Bacteroidales bacterium]|nr:FMN-binding protein [Bacteroidales bacterium]MCF8457592.1 FMN-binding protein [Bacteroidales bacterium]
MKKIFLLFLTILITSIGIAQAPIDFAPRQFFREIKKSLVVENPFVDELRTERVDLNGKFYSISTEINSDSKGYAYIGRVNSCRWGGCSSSDEASCGSVFEYFDYFILYDILGQVLAVRIYNYQATHGQEVTAKSWLKQFVGFNGEVALMPGKNVDAISGATISVNSISIEIEEKTKLLRSML